MRAEIYLRLSVALQAFLSIHHMYFFIIESKNLQLLYQITIEHFGENGNSLLPHGLQTSGIQLQFPCMLSILFPFCHRF